MDAPLHHVFVPCIVLFLVCCLAHVVQDNMYVFLECLGGVGECGVWRLACVAGWGTMRPAGCGVCSRLYNLAVACFARRAGWSAQCVLLR